MNERLSLTELQLVIRDSLYTALPGMYWVTAEISEIRENYSGHCYLELVEKHPDEVNVSARIKGVIWSNRYRFIKALFENVTGDSLKTGLKILIRAKIEYHEIYGISLVINDIDPAFTLGEMAMKRQQIIRKLEEEGVFTMNKELELKTVPQRIAVISSKNAAGYTDFITHLTGNKYGYSFSVALFEAAMQGTDTEKDITDALNRISELTDMFDAAVIIRGGGSQTDLSWFDNYSIAYHITQFPLPVITGIGHEKDLSVTDLVAWRSEKTPTAVADFLIGSLAGFEENILEMASEIRSITGEILNDNRRRLETVRIRLSPVAGMMVASEKGKLSEMMLVMRSVTAAVLKKEQAWMENKANSLVLLDPFRILQRGYTITSSAGKILKSAAMAGKGDTIETRFSDGTLTSEVSEKRIISKKTV
jgi:exodeoxyribonuclease VII large subunit